MCVRPRAHESVRGACSPPTASIAAFSLSIIDSARIVFVLHLSGSAPFPRARARAPPGAAHACALLHDGRRKGRRSGGFVRNGRLQPL